MAKHLENTQVMSAIQLRIEFWYDIDEEYIGSITEQNICKKR